MIRDHVGSASLPGVPERDEYGSLGAEVRHGGRIFPHDGVAPMLCCWLRFLRRERERVEGARWQKCERGAGRLRLDDGGMAFWAAAFMPGRDRVRMQKWDK
jgi:hypothetical protein